MTKTIKIPEKVHEELKVFVARSKDKIEDFAGFAIMNELKSRGHKFVNPPKSTKK